MYLVEVHRDGLIVHVKACKSSGAARVLCAAYNARTEKRWGPNSRAVLSY